MKVAHDFSFICSKKLYLLSRIFEAPLVLYFLRNKRSAYFSVLIDKIKKDKRINRLESVLPKADMQSSRLQLTPSRLGLQSAAVGWSRLNFQSTAVGLQVWSKACAENFCVPREIWEMENIRIC